MGYLAGLGDCPLAHGDYPGRCSWCGRPLTGRRARWCSDDCTRAWRLHHYWTAARAEALRRARGRCALCRSRENVEVHHLDPVADDGGYASGCQHHQSGLVVLCRRHHLAVEAIRRRRDRQAGRAPQIASGA